MLPNQKLKRAAVAAAVLFSMNASASDISLTDKLNHITVSPQNLAILWNKLEVNTGALRVNQEEQTVSNLVVYSSKKATWTLLPSGIRVSAFLDRGDLELTFTAPESIAIKRNAPVALTWFDLAEQPTDTLLLPFSEGMRVPTDNKTWASYLVDEYSGSDTVHNLKMPFWTAEQDDKFITYHVVTATNNELTFLNTKPHIDMSAKHHFTVLNKNEPFTVRITVGNDWLDGAKAYRNWREVNHLSSTLSEKRKQDANVEKLIGASHVYMFGKSLLSSSDVSDWWGLKDWYFSVPGISHTDEVSRELKNLKKGRDWLDRYQKQVLVDAINVLLKQKFPIGKPTLADNQIEAQYRSAQHQKQWLEKQASNYLIDSHKWGQAMSPQMVSTLKKAGLQKLWLGLSSWMPAFYQPEAVESAKKSGYLVGAYDSYNTAIPAGKNDSWLTAQLPDIVRQQCAIEMADGRKKKGFRGNGFYLNPTCHLDYVKQRVKDVVKYGHLNSLFLDVDATAMVREDFSNKSSEQQMLDGFNDRLDWISRQGNMVLGSEDGNSLTTQGIAFAHGLETVGFGWTDKDMKKNTRSPYFLGRWYPDYKPQFFFKSARVKEPYKTLLFSPEFRIPLYQTVFHDEVINSHHWHSDSLKFSDVKRERDLTSMLYNTPPMVHLARDEASSVNSPRVKALVHYQKGFLAIHTQLWDKKMVKFDWLDKHGVVQQTIFDDGSKIIANFGSAQFLVNGEHIPPYSIFAALSTGKVVKWSADLEN
ncbi:glycoside hydrolase [Veronia pacifica]|uniref:Glycosyl hydrolase n=1 Tax=Veronia pacifica TaxID=1080227 RepID=A0A1C3EDA6_9GAMM|nr:glycoside hydrolase [Veronia pacifica]ODA31218.1 glycosyl hydrolase [Veronia pacifica]